MSDLKNVILIGMPGSGKSTLGKIVAARWGWQFLDVDQFIIQARGKSLAQLQDEYGRDGFLRLEGDTMRGLRTVNTVIAPGGSVVYDHDAMIHLQQVGLVTYLEVSESEIVERIGDLRARGVVIAPGQTVLDLYHERHPLYLKYAQKIVPLKGMDPEQSANELELALKSP